MSKRTQLQPVLGRSFRPHPAVYASRSNRVPDIHGGAYVIDPPTIEAEDDQVVLCATECPHAHGQTFDTPSGEVSTPTIPTFSRRFLRLTICFPPFVYSASA